MSSIFQNSTAKVHFFNLLCGNTVSSNIYLYSSHCGQKFEHNSRLLHRC